MKKDFIASADVREINIGTRRIRLLSGGSSLHQKDGDGSEMWWFGGDPPDGIPKPCAFIEAIEANQIRKYPPPWAAVVYDPKMPRCWICTDPVGLLHLFMRRDREVIAISPECLKVANLDRVTIDAIGAYELLSVGHPQAGRTIFSQVKCLPPANLIEVKLEGIKESRYWVPPDLEAVPAEEAVERHVKAVRDSVVRHYREDDVQELTAGRDSLMILSALLHEGIRPTVWTNGEQDNPDLLGASERAKQFGVEHIVIRLEPLLEKPAEEIMELMNGYLKASGAQANAVISSYLPWVLKQLGAPGSISGIGGELFRGFYYQWMGKGLLPLWLGKSFLLHGKIKAAMPFPNPIVKKTVARWGDAHIHAEVNRGLNLRDGIWHSLDVYYLSNRLHRYAGSTFSAVSQWTKPRTPLFDPHVLDSLAIVPIELRHWTGGLAREVTTRLMPKNSLQEEGSYSYQTTSVRIRKMMRRAAVGMRQGWYYRGFKQRLFELMLTNEIALDCLNPEAMITIDLYNPSELRRAVEGIKRGEPIPSILAGILSIELAGRAVESEVTGVGEPEMLESRPK